MATKQNEAIESRSGAQQHKDSFNRKKATAIANQLETLERQLTKDALREMDEVDLQMRIEFIERILLNFESSQSLLEEEDVDELTSDARMHFFSTYIKLKSALTREIHNHQAGSPTHSSTVHASNHEAQSTIMFKHRSRLPELQLPSFSGAYTDWPDFLAIFNTVIDNEPDLTTVEKFQHLRSCLKESALDTVRSLEISETNYYKALDLLKARFDNKRIIFQAHIREIFGMKRVEANVVVNLRHLSDKINSHMRALQTIGNKEQIFDCLMIHLIAQKLDAASQSMWEEKTPLDVIPTWDSMAKFLEKRCQTLESVEYASLTKSTGNQDNRGKRKAFVTSKATAGGCVFCDQPNHLIYSCQPFASLSPSDRLKEVRSKGLCLNCLKKGHQMRQCKSTSCRHCASKHHTLLHLNSASSMGKNTAISSQIPTAQQSCDPQLPKISQSALMSTPAYNASSQIPNDHSNECVLLATAVILVKNRAGTFVPCRAVLDSASQLHFITSRVANQLQLRKSKSTTTISGIGETDFKAEHTVDIFVKSQFGEFSTTLTAIVAPTITDHQPNYEINTKHWDIPSNIKLADPSFYKPQRIDILIGASLFYEILCVGQIHLKPSLPLLQKTRFGWVAAGGGQHAERKSVLIAAKNCNEHDDTSISLDKMVRNFWEVENCFEPIVQTTQEELDCEAHFKNNYTRLTSGEYSVRLPIKHNIDLLGDSYQQALKRFLNLERRLQRDNQLKSQYTAFINEYKELRHMSLFEDKSPAAQQYFLPHHCVVKSESSSTKLRVVFDGSAASTSGYSLNEVLMAGPTIQPKLAHTLLRFRSFRIALTGDICKMYRCVRVTAPDDHLQCILWRDNRDENVQTYKLQTVTYGTKPASYLAIRAMHQLAFDEAVSYPVGAKAIFENFYVDDMMSGGSTVEEVLEIMQQTTKLLARGNCQLRKWCSNDPTVLRDVPDADKEPLLKFNDGNDITKALGLQWDPATDNFLFSFISQPIPSRVTKRSVLSTVARLYDPLGLVGPVISKSKIFLQRLWRENLDWDESLPISLQSVWLNLYGELHAVKNAAFPRYVSMPGALLEVHAFCDASLAAYGACIYIRACLNEEVRVNLLCSKSRVSPLKTLTVPKLELCAAALLAQVVNSLVSLKIFDCKFYCWSDSSVVLSWIKEEPSTFNVFVANRVSNIQQQTMGMEWLYVPTEMNPADILSKGATPKELLKSSLWKHGPTFLNGSRRGWPKSCLRVSELPEVRKASLISSPKIIDTSVRCKYVNSFIAMRRIYGYVSMFASKDKSGILTPEHIHQGTVYLIRMIQMVHFSSEYKALHKNHSISSSSELIALSPFLDSDGLLRVGGRLKNSLLEFNARHPILLPKGHPVTIAIIRYFHHKLLHAGPQSLLATIRLQYWPIGGRKAVTRVVNKCIRCFRAKPRLSQHIMGELPKERVQAVRAFFVTGIDFCGPFYYQSEVRNKTPVKCYICLFICFATKAVHMEMVKDLSTSAFLAALQRFICTRGKPKTIWSDNATNFTGAKNELADLKQLFLANEHREAVIRMCLDDGIDWQFIPPRSPHFGGLWEASIKTAKYHFYRTVGASVLNFDELRTLVCQISAVINSRPLLPLTEHPDDLDVLTPAHFLVNAPLTAIVQPDITALNMNRLSRWQRISYMQQIFWKKWSAEYLTLLQQRSKWQSASSNIPVGALVLIKDENLPPLKWPLARVIETIHGDDGVVRVAVVRTGSDTKRRAVAKLCMLPLNDALESHVLSTGGVCSKLHN